MTSVAVIGFPGSNCDRDIITAIEAITGKRPALFWHKETSLPSHDLVVLPGGFSFGDYLRCGAIAARSPVMDEVLEHAWRGGFILGICNGFQVLLETGLLPGTLMRNVNLKFVCRHVTLKAHNTDKPILAGLSGTPPLRLPVAHNEGNYFADAETLASVRDKGQIAFTYSGEGHEGNPNGSCDNIAGIMSENGRILGLMPHPERMVEPIHGGTDGRMLLQSVLEAAS